MTYRWNRLLHRNTTMALKQPTDVGIGFKSRRTPLTYVHISRKSYCCVHVLQRVLRYKKIARDTEDSQKCTARQLKLNYEKGETPEKTRRYSLSKRDTKDNSDTFEDTRNQACQTRDIATDFQDIRRHRFCKTADYAYKYRGLRNS